MTQEETVAHRFLRQQESLEVKMAKMLALVNSLFHCSIEVGAMLMLSALRCSVSAFCPESLTTHCGVRSWTYWVLYDLAWNHFLWYSSKAPIPIFTLSTSEKRFLLSFMLRLEPLQATQRSSTSLFSDTTHLTIRIHPFTRTSCHDPNWTPFCAIGVGYEVEPSWSSEKSSWGLLRMQSQSLAKAASHLQNSWCLSPKYPLVVWISGVHLSTEPSQLGQ